MGPVYVGTCGWPRTAKIATVRGMVCGREGMVCGCEEWCVCARGWCVGAGDDVCVCASEGMGHDAGAK